MFSDTHCHIFKEYYDVDEIMKSILEDDSVNFIINNSVDYKTALEVLKYSKKYKKSYFAIGLHPQENLNDIDKILNLIEKNLDNPKFLAIGEIGLDYYNSTNDRNIQQQIFQKQLDLAQKYNIPVIIHSREATQDTLNILKKYSVKGIIHCFSGSEEIAKEYINMGFLLGIGGVVTFKNCKLIDTLKNIGIDNIVLETDSPYLTPNPYRKNTNDPRYIKYIAEFLSDNLKIDINDIYRTCERNVCSLFDKN